MQRPEASEAEHNQSVTCVCRLWLSHACSTISTDLPRTEQMQACFSCCKTIVLSGLSLSLPLSFSALSTLNKLISLSARTFSAIFSAFILGTFRDTFGNIFQNPLLPEQKCRKACTPPLSGIYNPGGSAPKSVALISSSTLRPYGPRFEFPGAAAATSLSHCKAVTA